jgi:hypothetical protein
MLAQLEQRNLMSRNGRSIMVNDWSGLTDLAGFDPGYLT